MGRGDLTDAEWERLWPFLPVSNRRCGRRRDHRQVIDGILHRVRWLLLVTRRIVLSLDDPRRQDSGHLVRG
ncbi:transposase [Streptomyces decoyicus]